MTTIESVREMDRGSFERGFVQVYTGNGKGKTTAAMGLAVRAAGAGLSVFVAQFIKSIRYSEVDYLEQLGAAIECRQYGRGCWLGSSPKDEDIALVDQAVEEVRKMIDAEQYDVIVLDEIITACYFKLITVEEILELIENKPDRMELVLTGRYAPLELIEAADLVTEMREVKHYHQQGVLARKGVES